MEIGNILHVGKSTDYRTQMSTSAEINKMVSEEITFKEMTNIPTDITIR